MTSGPFDISFYLSSNANAAGVSTSTGTPQLPGEGLTCSVALWATPSTSTPGHDARGTMRMLVGHRTVSISKAELLTSALQKALVSLLSEKGFSMRPDVSDLEELVSTLISSTSIPDRS